MTKRPAPSVLYSDVIGREGGLFLTGELPVCSSMDELREMALLWSGVRAMLRPRERKAFGIHLEKAVSHIAAASRALEAFDNAADDLSESLRSKDDEGDGGPA